MLTPFGRQVRKVRLDHGMRLREMAQKLGKSAAYVSAIETGRKPIPPQFEEAIAHALKLSPAERRRLERAADKTRNEVKLGLLPEQSRELVAGLARRVDTLSADELKQIRKMLFRDHLKVADQEQPYHRNRRGFLVPPLSNARIQSIADQVRSLFVIDNRIDFPIIDVLELRLPKLVREFHVQVCSRSEIDGDEARTIPSLDTIVFAEDVYESACADDGRARFTASHELAHYILHGQISLSRQSDDFPIYRDSEWQADRFAGAILMPPDCLQHCHDADDMAAKCKVSPQAARVQWAIMRKRANDSRGKHKRKATRLRGSPTHLSQR